MPVFIYATIYFERNPTTNEWETVLVASENIDAYLQAALAETEPIRFKLSEKYNKNSGTYHSFRW